MSSYPDITGQEGTQEQSRWKIRSSSGCAIKGKRMKVLEIKLQSYQIAMSWLTFGHGKQALQYPNYTTLSMRVYFMVIMH